jgi:hypothetical protein
LSGTFSSLLFEYATVWTLDSDHKGDSASNTLGNCAEILELRQRAVQVAERLRRYAKSDHDLNSGHPQPVLVVPTDLADRRRRQTTGILFELAMSKDEARGKAICNGGRQQLRWRRTGAFTKRRWFI